MVFGQQRHLNSNKNPKNKDDVTFGGLCVDQGNSTYWSLL